MGDIFSPRSVTSAVQDRTAQSSREVKGKIFTSQGSISLFWLCFSSPHNFGVEPCKFWGYLHNFSQNFLPAPFSQGGGLCSPPRNEQKDELREKPFSTHKFTFIVGIFTGGSTNHSFLPEIWVKTATGKRCQCLCSFPLCIQTPQISHRPLPILHQHKNNTSNI